MSFLSRVVGFVKSISGSWFESGRSTGRMGNHFIPRWSYPPDRTQNEWLNLFHTSPRLDPVDMVAGDVAAVPFRLFNRIELKRNPEAEAIGDHPFYDFWENPMPDHPECDGWYMRYLTKVYLKLFGEAFWLLGRKSIKGLPIEAYPVPPSWVLWTPTLENPVFRVLPMGNVSYQMLEIAVEDMVWFKEPNIASPFGRGRGRAEAIGDELQADEYASKYSKKLFYNDAQPPLLIGLEDMGSDALVKMRDEWTEKYGGYQNARRPAFVNVKPHVSKLTDTPREMDMTESRRFLRDVCNQHFYIPPELFGVIENSNRSTIDSAYYLYAKNVLTKELDRFASMLNRQLVIKWGEDIVGRFDNVIPEDETAIQSKMTAGLQQGVVLIDEFRTRVLGLPELPKGAGQAFLRSIGQQLIPIDEEALTRDERNVTARRISGQLDGPDDKPDEESEDKPEEEEKPEDLPAKSKGLTVDQKTLHWKTVDTTARSHEPMFMSAVASFANKQYKIFLAEYELRGLEALDLIDGAKSNQLLSNALRGPMFESMAAGFDIAFALVGNSKSKAGRNSAFADYQAIFLAKLEDKGLRKAVGINNTTKQALRDTLSEGIAKGENSKQLQMRILKTYEALKGKEMEPWRARTIARTETISSINDGILMTFAGRGVPFKEWVSTIDEETRGQKEKDQFDHLSMNGQTVPIEEPFVEPNTGEQLMYPGDDEGTSAGNTINCRCTLIPIMEE